MILLAAGVALLLAGCSNLIVRKVPLDKRLAEDDHHIHGFRYYLSRPYVLVLQPILLTKTQTLVAMGADSKFTFLEGPQAGQVSSLEEQKKEAHHRSATVTPVSPQELARLKTMVPEQAAEGNAIQPVQFKRGNYTQNVIIAGQPSRFADPGAAVADLGADVAAKGADANPAAPPGDGAGKVPAPGTRKSAVLNGPIQIIFLPDMDEQYAIRSENFVSKSEFALQFRNGWELTDVYGNHDSTPVALSLIQTIGAAIDAAKTLSTAVSGKLVGAPGAPERGEPGERKQAKNWYILTRTTVLKPGIYRLNKPWEMGHGEQPTGCGLLTKLGLETFTTVELAPVTQKMSVAEQTVSGLVETLDLKTGALVVIDSTGKTVKLKIDDRTKYIGKDGKDVLAKDVATTFKAPAAVTVTVQADKATRVQLTKGK
jgi:hypothetical protein